MGCGGSQAVKVGPQDGPSGDEASSSLRSAADGDDPAPLWPEEDISRDELLKSVPSTLQSGHLKVQLISAKNLRPADRNGYSDPYCTCEIRGRPDSKVSTKHLTKSLNPQWKETHDIEDFEVGDTLEFSVYDHDRIGSHDKLGHVLLAGHHFLREGGFKGDLPLVMDGKGSGTQTLQVSVTVVPRRPDALPVSVPGSIIRVVMVGVSGLKADNWSIRGGKLFCSCQLAGIPDSSVQTRHLDLSSDAEWQEEHLVDSYTRGDALEFQVMNGNTLLGRAKLKFGEFDREDGFDGELRLKECKSAAAMLRVLVEVQSPELPDAPPVALPGSILKVWTISASGLRAADWNMVGSGKSDPYCVCEIPGKPDSKIETAYLPKTLDPVWNEEHEIDAFDPGDNLEFSVYDHDVGSGDDRLGHAILTAREYDREGGFEGDLRLKDCGSGKTSTLRVKVLVLPPDGPELEPVSEPGSRLRLAVIDAEGFQGSPDCFCICQIPGKEDSIVQTQRHKGTVSGVSWKEEFEVMDFDPGDDLSFKVMSYNRTKAADLIGNVMLKNCMFDHEGGFEGECQLKLHGRLVNTVLRIKVDVLPPALENAPPVSLPGSKLLVTVVRAAGLRAADFALVGKSTSDPFVECEIAGKPDCHFETRYIKQTLDPVWEEEHTIEDFEQGDDLNFTVFDYDKVGSNDKLGRVVMHSREYDREGGFEGELRLRECGKGKQATLHVKVLVLPPDMPDGPKVSEPGSRLCVHVISANGLRAADWGLMGGNSDPFCVVRIPGKPDEEFQTKHINKTLDPVWDEEFELDEFDAGDDLEFLVMDYDKLSGSDFLGRRMLPSFKFDREGGFDGELALKECGKGKKAMLKVHVKVLPPLTPAAPPVSELGSRLRMRIISASGLRAADWSISGGSSDPFCVCQIMGKPDTKFQTRVIEKSLEPVWDEERTMLNYELGDRLEFQVMDHDKRSGSDLLGRATLASRDYDREGGYTGTLELKKSGKKWAQLRVQVFVLPSVETEEALLAEARRLQAEQRREAEEREMMANEEKDQMLREEFARQQAAEEAAREAERKAKEAALKRSEDEAARREYLKWRAEQVNQDITVPVHPVFAPGELLAEVTLPWGESVAELSKAIYETARLPFQPRLLIGGNVLKHSDAIIDAGVRPGEPVNAEMSVVLTTSKDCTAKIWDATSGECLYTLVGHTEPVTAAKSLPDLKWIVTCSEDTTAKLWVVQRDTRTATCLFTLSGHKKAVNSVAFSEDGKWIVTGSADCTAKIWTVRTGECRRTFEGHRGPIISASFTPDGTRLETHSRDSTVRMWEIDTGRCTNTAALADVPSFTHTAASDGHMVVDTEGEDPFAVVYEENSDETRYLEGHAEDVLSVVFVDVRVPLRINSALFASQKLVAKSLSPNSKSRKNLNNCFSRSGNIQRLRVG